jgi:hypothetical protein
MRLGHSVSSQWDHLVLDRSTSFEPVNGAESRHLPVERHSTQAVQLAREGERDWMVDEVVTADAAAMQGEQMSVKTSDNGNEITSVLDGAGVGCGLLLDGVGTVGGGGSVGHDWLLGFGFKERCGVLRGQAEESTQDPAH